MFRAYTVDASVAVKWLNQTDEKSIDESFALLEGGIKGNYQLLSSDLLVHEVFNALLKGKQLDQKVLQRATEKFFTLPLTFVPTDRNYVAQAITIAKQLRITFYDAVYLAIANTMAAPLVTENVRHQGKFKKIPVFDIALWPDDDSYPTRIYTDEEIKRFLEEDRLK